MSTKDKPQVTVSAPTSRLNWLNARVIIIGAVIVCLLIGGVCWYVVVRRNDNKSNEAVNAASEKLAQSSLKSALSGATSSSGIMSATSQLINGVNNKTFTMSSSDLAQLYLQRATARMNLKQYKDAVSDYNESVKLDSLNKKAALQGEVEAEYRLGERKQLIPQFQELISIMQAQTDNPFAGSYIAQYQASIAALQSDKGITAYEN